jgi:hypothetical protein
MQDASSIITKLASDRTANFPKIDPPVADARLYGVMTQNWLPRVQSATANIVKHSALHNPRENHHFRTADTFSLTPMDAESYSVIREYSS